MRLTEVIEGFRRLYDDKLYGAIDDDKVLALLMQGMRRPVVYVKARICVPLCTVDAIRVSEHAIPAFNSLVAMTPERHGISVVTWNQARAVLARDRSRPVGWVQENRLHLANYGGDKVYLYGYWDSAADVLGFDGCEVTGPDHIEVFGEINRVYESIISKLAVLRGPGPAPRQQAPKGNADT
ncbi:MAG: hypothetical protein D6746_08620 [Bacteroidetes bacterium]|nr:MAG: hypothetical protein D6746_08620 [Bacteroidota bacterium]